MEEVVGLEEFLVVRPRDNNTSANPASSPASFDASSSSSNVFFWTVNNTKLLIDLYKKYRDMVGSMKIRNFKAMWKLIAKEISKILGTDVSEKNVENRWKVLERNFKKYVDNKNATGRGRKFFEFAADMEEAYGNKRSIKPEILLGSETTHVPISVTSQITEQEKEQENITNTSESGVLLGKKVEVVRKRNVRNRKTVLQQIREDKLEYQEKRLNFLRQAHEETMTLVRERNEIEKERNRILKEKKCSCQLLDKPIE